MSPSLRSTALALTVAAAIWLGRIQLGSRTEKVSVRFRTVDGLAVGAPVTLRGVKIGTVHSIELADDNWVLAPESYTVHGNWALNDVFCDVMVPALT